MSTKIFTAFYGYLMKHYAAFLVPAFIVGVSLLRASSLPEGDVFWSARNGMDTLSFGLQVMIPDVWNNQTLGEIWSPNSWLWNVLLGGFYVTFSTLGFFMLVFLGNLFAYMIVWALTVRFKLHPFFQFYAVFFAWGALNVYMNGRANMADVIVVLLYALLLAYLLLPTRRISSRKMVFTLAVTFLFAMLWMNLHLTGVLAVVVFPLVVLAYLNREVLRKKLLVAAAVAVVSAAGIICTPFGVDGLLKVLLVQDESSGFFLEWANILNAGPLTWGVLLTVVVGVVIGWAAYRDYSFVYTLGIIGFTVASLTVIRFQLFLAVLVIIGFMYLKEELPVKLNPFSGVMSVIAVLLSVTLVTAGGFSVIRVLQYPSSILPARPNTFIGIPDGSVVAAPVAESGVLILYRQDSLVVLDGRNDLLGRDRFAAATNFFYETDAKEAETWLTENGVDVVYLPDKEQYQGTVKVMEQLGWQPVTIDGTVAYREKPITQV